MAKNKITEILQHDISWYVLSPFVKELDEVTINHIEEWIKDGFSQGELCITYGKNHDKETTGWWHIIDWKDIALGLYNATKQPGLFEGEPSGAIQGAQQRFDNAWTY